MLILHFKTEPEIIKISWYVQCPLPSRIVKNVVSQWALGSLCNACDWGPGAGIGHYKSCDWRISKRWWECKVIIIHTVSRDERTLRFSLPNCLSSPCIQCTSKWNDLCLTVSCISCRESSSQHPGPAPTLRVWTIFPGHSGRWKCASLPRNLKEGRREKTPTPKTRFSIGPPAALLQDPSLCILPQRMPVVRSFSVLSKDRKRPLVKRTIFS